jgi:hypothetical protein
MTTRRTMEKIFNTPSWIPEPGSGWPTADNRERP